MSAAVSQIMSPEELKKKLDELNQTSSSSAEGITASMVSDDLFTSILHPLGCTGEFSSLSLPMSYWPIVRDILVLRFNLIFTRYCESFKPPTDVDGESGKLRFDRMSKLLAAFERPPFTLQRISELLHDPFRYYSSTNKFLLAFSKLVCGISGEVLEDGLDMDWNEQKEIELNPSSTFNTPFVGEVDEVETMFPITTAMPNNHNQSHPSSSHTSSSTSNSSNLTAHKLTNSEDLVEHGISAHYPDATEVQHHHPHHHHHTPSQNSNSSNNSSDPSSSTVSTQQTNTPTTSASSTMDQSQ